MMKSHSDDRSFVPTADALVVSSDATISTTPSARNFGIVDARSHPAFERREYAFLPLDFSTRRENGRSPIGGHRPPLQQSFLNEILNDFAPFVG